MTGFRIAFGGATEYFGVTPDLTALGKVIGGGLPVAAYGGSRTLMEHIAPTGPVYQAGTLSGNPLAMAAGIATLGALTRSVHDEITNQTAALVDGLRGIATRRGVPLSARHVGSMWGFFFRDGDVHSFDDAKQSDVALFRRFFTRRAPGASASRRPRSRRRSCRRRMDRRKLAKRSPVSMTRWAPH